MAENYPKIDHLASQGTKRGRKRVHFNPDSRRAAHNMSALKSYHKKRADSKVEKKYQDIPLWALPLDKLFTEFDWNGCLCTAYDTCTCNRPLVPMWVIEFVAPLNPIAIMQSLSKAHLQLNSHFEAGLRSAVRCALNEENSQEDAFAGIIDAILQAKGILDVATLEGRLTRCPIVRPRHLIFFAAGFMCGDTIRVLKFWWDDLWLGMEVRQDKDEEGIATVLEEKLEGLLRTIRLGLQSTKILEDVVRNPGTWKAQSPLLTEVLSGLNYWCIQQILFQIYIWKLLKGKGWSFAMQVAAEGVFPWEVGWSLGNQTTCKLIYEIMYAD